MLNLLAGKEGHISNLNPADLEAILDFIDRYKPDIEAVRDLAESTPQMEKGYDSN